VRLLPPLSTDDQDEHPRPSGGSPPAEGASSCVRPTSTSWCRGSIERIEGACLHHDPASLFIGRSQAEPLGRNGRGSEETPLVTIPGRGIHVRLLDAASELDQPPADRIPGQPRTLAPDRQQSVGRGRDRSAGPPPAVPCSTARSTRYATQARRTPRPAPARRRTRTRTHATPLTT
jgi:hypothetical protein